MTLYLFNSLNGFDGTYHNFWSSRERSWICVFVDDVIFLYYVVFIFRGTSFSINVLRHSRLLPVFNLPDVRCFLSKSSKTTQTMSRYFSFYHLGHVYSFYKYYKLSCHIINNLLTYSVVSGTEEVIVRKCLLEVNDIWVPVWVTEVTCPERFTDTPPF